MIIFRDVFRFAYFSRLKFFFDILFLMIYAYIVFDFFEKKSKNEFVFDVKHPKMHHVENEIFYLTECISDLLFIVRIKRFICFQFFSNSIRLRVIFIEVGLFQRLRRIDFDRAIILWCDFRDRRRSGNFATSTTRFFQLILKFRYNVFESDSIVNSVFFRVLKVSCEVFSLFLIFWGFLLYWIMLKKECLIVFDNDRENRYHLSFFMMSLMTFLNSLISPIFNMTRRFSSATSVKTRWWEKFPKFFCVMKASASFWYWHGMFSKNQNIDQDLVLLKRPVETNFLAVLGS